MPRPPTIVASCSAAVTRIRASADVSRRIPRSPRTSSLPNAVCPAMAAPTQLPLSSPSPTPSLLKTGSPPRRPCGERRPCCNGNRGNPLGVPGKPRLAQSARVARAATSALVWRRRRRRREKRWGKLATSWALCPTSWQTRQGTKMSLQRHVERCPTWREITVLLFSAPAFRTLYDTDTNWYVLIK